MNRRGILKLLGAATVGTLAHEQLLWLARAPVSVSSRVLEPNTVSFDVRGILPGDTVRIYSGGVLIDEKCVGGVVWASHHDEVVSADQVSGKVYERDVVVNVRGNPIKPVKPFVVNA